MLFRFFCVVYAAVLLLHARHLDLSSWQAIAAVGLGFAVAAFAHARYGLLTMLILIVHMCLEWTEHARHSWMYSHTDILIHAVHASMDIAFLHRGLVTYAERYHRCAMVSVLGLIVCLFFVQRNPAPRHVYERAMILHAYKSHSHGAGWQVQTFVLGGMLGCVISHLCRKIV